MFISKTILYLSYIFTISYVQIVCLVHTNMIVCFYTTVVVPRKPALCGLSFYIEKFESEKLSSSSSVESSMSASGFSEGA